MATMPTDTDRRRLHNELEPKINSINQALISEATGTVSREDFVDVAKMVACLRARYLHRVLTEGKRCRAECIGTDVALELKQLREAYNEALNGFAALEHALKRGYLELNN